jgi:DNA-directed RNA polymerase specialized sigma24 family protein
MFQETPDVSVELEWMLQNRQVSPKRLAETLLAREYLRTLRLACSLLVDFSRAQRATIDAFASVLLNNRPYWGETSLTLWLDSLVVEACLAACRNAGRVASPELQKPPRLSGTTESPADEPPVLPLEVDPLWQAIRSLPEKLRFPLVLADVHSRSIAETSALLGISQENARVLQYMGREALARQLDSAGQPFPIDDPAVLPDRLAGAHENLCPAPALTTAAIENLTRQVLERAHLRQNRQRQGSRRREVLWIGSALVFLISILWIQNLSLPVQGQQPRLSTPIPTNARPANLLPETGARSPEAASIALNEYASPQEVRQRILESQGMYHTLWVDAQVIDYGPANYVGPPQTYRNRLWIHQPDNILVAVGRPNSPEVMLAFQGSRHFGTDLRTGQVFQGANEPTPPFDELLPFVRLAETPYQVGRPLSGFYLGDLIFPAVFHALPGSMDVLGMEMAAGRHAVVVDWIPGAPAGAPAGAESGKPEAIPVTASSNLVRLWVDASTGVILRWRIFDGIQPTSALMDVTVTALAIDATFPEDLFYPRQKWSTSLQWEDLWQPVVEGGEPPVSIWADPPLRELLSYSKKPPAAFDPAGSRLTFQQMTDQETGQFDRTQVDIFADGYFLSQVYMGNPFNLLCERSSDGRSMAWTPSPGRIYRQGSSLLRWIHLDSPRDIHVQVGAGEDFAFSPDGRYLVYHSCLITGCGVDILDIETGETMRILALDSAGLFTWSPDGAYLALVGSLPSPVDPWKLFVFRTRAPGRTFSKITYTHPIDPENPVLPADAPLHHWDVEFPPVSTGIDGCR